MTLKIITVPKDSVKLYDENDRTKIIGEKLVFVRLAEIVVESTPLRSTAEILLAHGIKEKLEEVKRPGKLELDEAEYDFLKNAFDKLMAQEKIVGALWYVYHRAISNAEEVKGNRSKARG